MKYIKHIFCLLTLFLVLSPAMAADQEKENIDLEEILMGHIKDSYEWHITDFMGKPIVLHLPVIVKARQDGMYFAVMNLPMNPMNKVTGQVLMACILQITKYTRIRFARW